MIFARVPAVVTVLFDILLAGLANSALYVMIALGLTLIFGLMGVLNFAHGSFTMFGAYVGGIVLVLLIGQGTGQIARLGVFLLALLVGFGSLAVLGGLLEKKLVRPLYDHPPVQQVLLMFGLLLVFDEVARIGVGLYGLEPTSSWQAVLGTAPVMLSTTYSIGPFEVWGLALFEIALGALTVAAVGLFLTRSRYGLIIRAGSEDAEMLQGIGIDVRRVFTVVFAFGTGLAGIAGVLLAWDPRFGASVPLGVETLLIAFIVVIVGGLGTFRGTVYAALLIGMIDSATTWLFQNHVAFPALPELTIFTVLVVILAIRPRGLFGIEEVGDH